MTILYDAEETAMLKKSNSRTGAVAVWGRPLLFGTLAGALCTLLLLFAAAAICVATDVPAGLVPLLAFQNARNCL